MYLLGFWFSNAAVHWNKKKQAQHSHFNTWLDHNTNLILIYMFVVMILGDPVTGEQYMVWRELKPAALFTVQPAGCSVLYSMLDWASSPMQVWLTQETLDRKSVV